MGVGVRQSFGPYVSYIDAQSWTTGVANPTVNGIVLTTGNVTTPGVPFVTTGYDNRTPGGGGVIKLVAPGGLMSTLGGNLPLFVSMTLTFVPEPGTLLLVGFGLAGLIVYGQRRGCR
jgi:hypothetical protein